MSAYPPELGEQIERAGQATGEAVRAVLLFAASLAVFVVQGGRTAEGKTETTPPLADKATMARRLAVSAATLDRAVREGCPVVVIGTRRRFDATAVEAWFASMGSKPTTPKTPPPDEDRLDVRGALARAGLRVVGASRQAGSK